MAIGLALLVRVVHNPYVTELVGRHASYLCSNRLVAVQRPVWWCYPERCSNGHEWGPGRVLVSWQHRSWRGRQVGAPGRSRLGAPDGACQVPVGHSVWFRPRHEPGTGR